MRFHSVAIGALETLLGLVLILLEPVPAVAEGCTNTGFAPINSFAVGRGPFAVTVGDFNGDGKIDLVVANHVSHDITILLGDGNGGFKAAAGSPVAAGYFPAAVVVSDFNGDGKADLAVANFTNQFGVTILLGDGNGGFSPARGSPIGLGFFPDALATGDFNGDGRVDLAVVT